MRGAVARALANGDALVMPSSLEGYGIAATEAIHAGTPVIAARTPGLEEALAPCPDATLFADPADRGRARDHARALRDRRFAARLDDGRRASRRSAHAYVAGLASDSFRAALMG